MENKGKRCSTCKYFDRYYYKSVTHFHATEFGFCFKKREIIKVNGCCCEQYLFKKQKRSNRILTFTLNDLLTKISEIRDVLCEEQDDGKNV